MLPHSSITKARVMREETGEAGRDQIPMGILSQGKELHCIPYPLALVLCPISPDSLLLGLLMRLNTHGGRRGQGVYHFRRDLRGEIKIMSKRMKLSWPSVGWTFWK